MRCPALAALVLLAAASPAVAGDQPKPNTLTPKEVAEGWILLFDGETTFGWKVEGEAGTFAVEQGALRVAAARVRPTTQFPSYELSYEYRIEGNGTAGVSLNGTEFVDRATAGDRWPRAYLSVQGGKGALKFDNKDPGGNLMSPEPIQPTWITTAQTSIRLRNVKLRPLGTQPLFNGKDLAGWQVFRDPTGKRERSKVTVTEAGEINIKDGPGDLQTEGKYGDFILQLECKSNGKHLNSGIFFRARPGEYQNGYEAQIRNQFTETAAQEYVVEEYDPKTHKLVGKRTVKSPAVDYGTGAIYRRVPARKPAAKDGEWFTLTLVARGNHFATWVNGIQQVDWTDNRPPSDNARTGYRREAGHLSIQGHDPTTDLSFRNLRIAELPAAK